MITVVLIFIVGYAIFFGILYLMSKQVFQDSINKFMGTLCKRSKYFIVLLVGFVGSIGFSNAGLEITYEDITQNAGTYGFDNYIEDSLYCVEVLNPGCGFNGNYNGVWSDGNSQIKYHGTGDYVGVCLLYGGGFGYELRNTCNLRFTRIIGIGSSTEEECIEEYGLITTGSVDSEYCELNGLCETIGGSGSSTLYINDIWHESAPFIYVNIPDEIKRDYLTGFNEFTINVEGLNGDQDYINGIIDVNSYRPTSEDFTQTFVGGLTLIFPYIIITAVILFIRRFIRKIFK